MTLAQNLLQLLSGNKLLLTLIILLSIVNNTNAKNNLNKTDSISISLILPFNTNKGDYTKYTENKNFNKHKVALNYYKGFKLGIDSAAANKKINLFVFDSKDDTSEVRKIASNNDIINSNLIVGPVYNSELKTFNSAIQNKYFVSPLLPRIVPENNPYLILPNTPLYIHAKRYADFIIKYGNTKKVILIKDDDSDEENFIVPFKMAFIEQNSNIEIKEICISRNNFDNVISELTKEETNVIVGACSEKSFIRELVLFMKKVEDIAKEKEKELHKTINKDTEYKYKGPIYKYMTFVFPNSEKHLDELNLSSIEKYNIYLSTSYFVDRSRPEVANFIAKYKATYGTNPSDFAIKGFDAGFYFSSLVLANPDNFYQNLPSYQGIHNNFNFIQTENGLLNQHTKILRIEGSKFIEFDEKN